MVFADSSDCPEDILTSHRLNSKLKAREVEIHDLVHDLSDGVRPTSPHIHPLLSMFDLTYARSF